MQVKELAAFLEKEADYSISNIKVRVKILDVRATFGRTDFKISPLSGSGETWVSSGSVTIINPPVDAP